MIRTTRICRTVCRLHIVGSSDLLGTSVTFLEGRRFRRLWGRQTTLDGSEFFFGQVTFPSQLSELREQFVRVDGTTCIFPPPGTEPVHNSGKDQQSNTQANPREKRFAQEIPEVGRPATDHSWPILRRCNPLHANYPRPGRCEQVLHRLIQPMPERKLLQDRLQVLHTVPRQLTTSSSTSSWT